MQARQTYILDISDRVTVAEAVPSTIRVEVNAGKRQGVDLVLMGPHALALRDRLNKLMPPAPETLGFRKALRKHSKRLSDDERVQRSAAAPGAQRVLALLEATPIGWHGVVSMAEALGTSPASVRTHLSALLKIGKVEKRNAPDKRTNGAVPVEWRVKRSGLFAG